MDKVVIYNVGLYCRLSLDDGYSGLNFNRPAFNEMLSDIESGKINMVITKDLSRKVKLAKRSRALDGLFISAQTPFAYIKDSNNTNHLAVDEEAKPIIIKIFQLAKEGLGTYRIVKILNEEGVITPSRYKFLKGDTRFARFNNIVWRTETVNAILTDMVYCGHIENHKYEVSNYKTKKMVRVSDSEHIIVRNTHEAIISEDLFEIVNNMIKSRISPRIHESEKLFKSIVYCAHCGNRMVSIHQTRNSNYVSQIYKCHKHNRD